MRAPSLAVFLVSISLGIGATCPPPTYYSAYDNSCYYAHNSSISWYKAVNFCRSIGGDLFVPSNAFDTTMFNAMLQDFHMNGSWLGIFNEDGLWEDENGGNVSYTHWAPGQPSLNNICAVVASNGYWQSSDCSRNSSFVCRIPPTSPTTTTAMPPAAPNYGNPKCPGYSSYSYPCSAGWRFYLPTCSCYLPVYNVSAPTWYVSEEMCVKNGAHLASIHSQDEAVFVKSMVNDRLYIIKIGLQYIGKSWVWSDGTSTDYLSWALRGVGSYGENDCAILYSDDYYFSTYMGIRSCTSGYTNAVCKKSLI